MVFPVIYGHHIWWFKVTKFQLSNSFLLPVFIICGFLLKNKKTKKLFLINSFVTLKNSFCGKSKTNT